MPAVLDTVLVAGIADYHPWLSDFNLHGEVLRQRVDGLIVLLLGRGGVNRGLRASRRLRLLLGVSVVAVQLGPLAVTDVSHRAQMTYPTRLVRVKPDVVRSLSKGWSEASVPELRSLAPVAPASFVVAARRVAADVDV